MNKVKLKVQVQFQVYHTLPYHTENTGLII